MNSKTLIILNFLIFNLGIVVLMNKSEKEKPPIVQVVEDPIQMIEVELDINYDIEDPIPSYLSYEQTVLQLKKWNEEAPKLTRVGTYGKSNLGEDLYYIKVSSPKKVPKKTVMITSCIHGNEPLSASTTMGYIGTILDQYGDNEKITQLIDSRDIYFVPVVSPDSYPHSRHVDGVDPNRNFPTRVNPNKKSVPPVEEIKNFFKLIKPNAAISGHTWGRVYLTPYGDQRGKCPNDYDYNRIIGKMSELSGYKSERASQLYGRPIYGTDVDWYYRNGAFSIVVEFGTHQRIPSMTDIQTEFDKTFEAVLHFIEEAPKVEIKFFVEDQWKKAA